MPMRQSKRRDPEKEGGSFGPAHNAGMARMGPPLGKMRKISWE